MLSWVRERERETGAPCKVPFSNWIHACALASPRGAPGEQTGRTHRCYGTTGRTLVKRLVAARLPSPAVKVALATDDTIRISRTKSPHRHDPRFCQLLFAKKRNQTPLAWKINRVSVRRRIMECIKIEIVEFFYIFNIDSSIYL